MNSELSAALKDLGLTATEAAIYVALLEHCGDGPLSAYKLAQELGRDPANMTKALAATVKRGAAVVSGKRPKLYAPAQPREFIDSLVTNLQERREQAVAMLEQLGTPPPDDGRPHPLDERSEALDVARRLLADAERVVLVNASPEWLAELRTDLEQAAAERGAMVVIRHSELVTAPGPWLRMVVDGRLTLNVVAPPDGDTLLFGEWSSNPARAFLQHRELSQAAVLDDLTEMLEAGAPTASVKRRADEQLPQLLASVPWKRRWQEVGVAPYTPLPAPSVDETTAPEVKDLDPAAVAEAMAEVDAEFTPEMPGAETEVANGDEDRPQTDVEVAEPAAEQTTDQTPEPDGEPQPKDDGGPLRFIFRRRRTD